MKLKVGQCQVRSPHLQPSLKLFSCEPQLILFLGIEDCNKEWQSRSRTEIILKFIAINLSTLTLVAQLGSSLGMPLRSRVWFVIRTAVLPVWSLVTFYLQLLTSVGHMIHEKLEGDSSVTFLACRAIGMVSTAEVDTPYDEHGVPELPRHIPLSEARCFLQKDPSQQDVTDAEAPVQFRYRRTKSRWTSQISNIVLTLIYLVQAITTIILIFRRLTIANKIPPGEPFIHIDTDPGIAVTSFESQAMLLSMYGVSMSIVYILLQIFPIQWNHMDNRQEWIYVPGSMGSSVRRMLLGLGAHSIIQSVLQNFFEYSTVAVFFNIEIYFFDPQDVAETVGIESGFLTAILALAAFSFPWRRLTVWLYQAFGAKIPGLWGSLRLIWHTVDYARQDPTRYWVLGNDGYEVPTSSNTAHLKYTDSEALDLLVGKISFVYIGLMHFGLILIYRDLIFHKVEILSTPAESESGCIFETKLIAWMWKDPIADSLWAF